MKFLEKKVTVENVISFSVSLATSCVVLYVLWGLLVAELKIDWGSYGKPITVLVFNSLILLVFVSFNFINNIWKHPMSEGKLRKIIKEELKEKKK